MDPVRFGRALGVGTRAAAKTLVTAVDAAVSENPSAKSTASANTARPASSEQATRRPVRGSAPSVVAQAAQSVTRAVVQGRETQKGIRRGSKQFGHAVWNPFVRLGGAVALEVAGVFFGIFAIVAGVGLWRMRGSWHSGSGQHQQMILAAVMLVVFGYFCVSSFVRARRREQGR